jgi:4'-phosphopantetheinyl transferase EntD
MPTKSSNNARTNQVMATLLPSPPFYFALCETSKDPQVLHPSELPLIAGAGIKRQQEFCSGRFCAHQALDRLGYHDIPLLADQYGAPVWPCGITGSISHSGGIAVAAAVQKKTLAHLESISKSTSVLFHTTH